jgi:hypothetical protein
VAQCRVTGIEKVALFMDVVPDHNRFVHACREACGACCIAPSISSAIPGMPNGKPAGVRCVQLGDDLRCAIFGDPRRPSCCSGLQPSEQMCGPSRDFALAWLTQLEIDTQPEQPERI